MGRSRYGWSTSTGMEASEERADSAVPADFLYIQTSNRLHTCDKWLSAEGAQSDLWSSGIWKVSNDFVTLCMHRSSSFILFNLERWKISIMCSLFFLPAFENNYTILRINFLILTYGTRYLQSQCCCQRAACCNWTQVGSMFQINCSYIFTIWWKWFLYKLFSAHEQVFLFPNSCSFTEISICWYYINNTNSYLWSTCFI